MSESPKPQENLPKEVAALKERGFAIWSTNELSSEFMARFDKLRIPVLGVRQVRVWGIQVDDERELPGHERTSIPDEELWEIMLQAKDGSSYAVNSRFVTVAP
jgi:hypothetical protein